MTLKLCSWNICSIKDKMESDLESNHFNFDKEINVDENFYNNAIQSKCSYYSEKGFNTKMQVMNSNMGHLTIMHLNCRSLVAHINEIKEYLYGLVVKIDVIALSETWLIPNQHDLSDFNIDEYKMYVMSRNNKHGGGVCIYVREDLESEQIGIISKQIENCYESIFVNIKLQSTRNVKIGCIYRAPNTDMELFNDEMLATLEFFKNNNVYLCGDFNVDLLKYNEHQNSRNFINTMFSYGYYPMINYPTRITCNSATIIDNIFTNVLHEESISGIIINDITDHLPIFCLMENVCVRKIRKQTKQNKYKFIRQTKDDNINNFVHNLKNVDWNDVIACEDINNSYCRLLNKYVKAFDDTCPIIKVKCKDKPDKPWLTKGLINAIRKKNNMYKLFVKFRTIKAESKYKTYKNRLTNVLRYAEKKYYNDMLNQCKKDLKKTWNILNDLTRRKKKKPNLCSEFSSGDHIVTNGKNIANSFNTFFTDIGPNLAKNISECPDNKFTDYLDIPKVHSLFLKPVTSDEIVKIVTKFRNKFSCGIDGVSMSIVKKTISVIAQPLAEICNKSFINGIFPDKMKIAKVIPVFKNGDKKLFSNYRPISVLPQFSKIFEKLFYNRLIEFIKRFNLLYDGQYGFREKHSTSLALMELIEDITDNYDRNNFTIGVFIDLKKAFDTINHNILIKKLSYYGIRGKPLQWLESYLLNRKQYVCYNNVESEMSTVVCGIPQGSILGPILFLLYINDLANVSNKLKCIMFADDTNVFYSDKCLEDVYKVVNDELNKMNNWLKVNKLSLNVDKTKYMIFMKKPGIHEHNIIIDQINVERVKDTKFLGIQLDEKLKWDVQIHSVSKNMSKGISVLYKLKPVLDNNILYSLYCTLILPYMNYACEIWGNTYQTKLKDIITLQKRAIRNVDKIGYRDHTDPVFVKYNCLKFDDIVQMKTLSIIHQAKNKNLPRNIQKLFSESDLVHNYKTRSISKGNFDEMFCRTKTRSMAISVRGVKLWNNLDEQYHKINELGKFKKMIKRKFIASYDC